MPKTITKLESRNIRDRLATESIGIGGTKLHVVYDTEKPAGQTDAWRMAPVAAQLEDCEECAIVTLPHGLPLSDRRDSIADSMSEIMAALEIDEIA